SDVACPWCFIGSRHLATALDASEIPVAVRWRAFQLDPTLGYEGVPAAERLAAKFGDEAVYRSAAARVTDIGAAVGIDFDTDSQIATNTGRAHQLVAAADEEDLADEMVAALFSAYFEQGRHIGDPAILTEVATAVGLDDAATVVDDVLADRWAESVAADVADAADLGIRGVPTFVAERRVAVSGAVPPETLGVLFERVR
ncbi:MAG: DsbA family oxidoreductase, partial [Acidimicrobiia bacterium]